MRSVFCVLCLAATVGALRTHTAVQVHNDDVAQDMTDAAVADVMAILRIATRRLLNATNATATNATTTNATTTKAAGVKNVTSDKLSQNVTENLKKEQKTLDALFAHLKQGISHLNSHETSNKAAEKDQVTKLTARVEEDHMKANWTNLTTFDKELLVNRTRMDETSLKFFTRGRSLEHDMYHANLKVNHSLMSRVKMVMDAYAKVLANGKIDPNLAASLKSVATSLPAKALIQVYQAQHRVSQQSNTAI